MLGEPGACLSALDNPRRVRLALEAADYDVPTDEARQAGKLAIDAAVRHLIGFGKLQWGRTFDGVEVKDVQCIDSSGRSRHVVFLEPAYDHMLPEDYADMVERLGHPRPELPDGVHDVNALDLGTITALADNNPDIARVLHLVALMLDGEDDIDWAAGYSVLEVIEQDAHRRGLSGQALGWWTDNDLRRFKQMANSVEAVGIRSRHQGHLYDSPKQRLTPKEAGWFVRRVAARWLARLAETEVTEP